MYCVVWLVAGGLIGWVVTVCSGTNGRQGMLLNVVVGIIGAAVGGRLYSGVFTINQASLTVSELVVSLLGAAALIGATSMFRGTTSR